MFYQTALLKLEEYSEARQTLEAIIFSCATSEIVTQTKFVNVDDDTLSKIFERYERILSATLENWSAENQDLFD